MHDYTYTTPEELEARVAYLKELDSYQEILDLLTDMPDLPMKVSPSSELDEWRKKEW